jgi:hydroxyacylglutathione hydrolase
MLQITYVTAFTDNYIWLLHNTETTQIICVDPGQAEPVMTYLIDHKLTLGAILLTHHHLDHIGGAADLLQQYPNTPVYGPNDARIALPLLTPATFSLLGFTFEQLLTPGHTASHICWYEINTHSLFCGDTLFSAGCGRIFDSHADTLFKSLCQLKALPDATQVYCGHEYTEKNLRFAATVEPHNTAIAQQLASITVHPGCTLPSSIGLEKAINPFLRTAEPAVQHYASTHGCSALDPLSVFIHLRHAKDAF